MLLSHGSLLRCSSLLESLGGAVAKGNMEEGMELVGKFHFLIFTRLLVIVLPYV